MNQDQDLNLLDETLDDLADAPSTELWPAGAYEASVKISRMDKKPTSYVINMTCVQPIEMSDPAATAPAAGDTSAVFIHTVKKDGSKNEFGQGQLKAILAPIAQALNTRSIADILEATKNGIDAIVVVKVRKSKDPAYADSQELVKLELPQ
jgi:hypothetical protein